MANNKVIFGNETVMDITDSTVTPEKLKQGEVAYNSAGQRIVGTLVTIGHKILDAFGNLMTNRENLQFQGTYVSDDATNNKTVVPIVRSMQQAEFEQLTAAEKTGLINVLDSGYTPTEDTRLLDLKDCSIVLPGNGQVLKYNSDTGKWVNADEVSIPEIVDNLTTDDATKTLSAKQGKVLKDITDAIPRGTVTSVSGGTGLQGTVTGSGSIGTYMPRVQESVNIDTTNLGSQVIWKEYHPNSANLPTTQWFHVTTFVSPDTMYATQLALGMTTQVAYYRSKQGGTWQSWLKLTP